MPPICVEKKAWHILLLYLKYHPGLLQQVGPHVGPDDVELFVEVDLDVLAEAGAVVVQVWSPTQYYSVYFSKSRINGKKCVFSKRTTKVCVSCC